MVSPVPPFSAQHQGEALCVPETRRFAFVLQSKLSLRNFFARLCLGKLLTVGRSGNSKDKSRETFGYFEMLVLVLLQGLSEITLSRGQRLHMRSSLGMYSIHLYKRNIMVYLWDSWQ